MASGQRSGVLRVSRSRGPRIALALFWLAFVMVAPVRADDGTPPDSPPPAEEPTDVPAPEPTDVPPPPPTDVPPPPPTDIPPPPPTDVPVIPTEVPPTEIPPTEIPTEEPTAEPTEEPSPTPTPEPDPAIPFDPALNCSLIDGGRLAVAGETTWSYQDCTVTWQTENVSSVVLQASTAASGWQVIAVNGDDLANPDAIAAADGVLDLTDTNADDDGFFTSRFSVGAQMGCTSATSAQVQLQLTATSTAPVPEDDAGNPIQIENEVGELEQVPPGDPVTETTLDDLVVDATAAITPTVSITAASFTPIDLMEGVGTSTGTLQIAYDAPTNCAWQITLAYGDFVDGEYSIPVAALNLVEITGLDGASVSYDAGTFIIIPPVVAEGATTGSFTISTSLELPGFLPEGSYTTTITASAMVMP